MNARRKTTRREFLQGRSARDALIDLSSRAGAAGEGPWRPDAADGRPPHDYHLRISRRAMACDFEVFLHCGPQAGAVEAATHALDLLEPLEDQLSVFRPQSDLSLINRDAAQRACRVEPRLFELLCRCADWSRATGGAYDITAGPLVRVWGFATRSGHFPQAEQVSEAMQRVGSQYLTLDRRQHTIRFARPGMELNLGSVGKGYALDRCAEVLEAAGVRNFLIHGGQSSVLVRGGQQAREDAHTWCVALCHPLRPERRLAELQISHCGLGTSGSGQQFFFHQGRRYGHVLDPRRGTPAEGVLSATVLAPDAAEADALATACFVLGVDAARAYCATRPELTVIFVLPGTRDATVAIETIGDAGQLRVLDEQALDKPPDAGPAAH